jgi:undecaprenyl-diphosphatase
MAAPEDREAGAARDAGPPGQSRVYARYLELMRTRWSLSGALALLALGGFLKLTSELAEGELDPIDRALLGRIVALRVRSLNGAAVDLTALGSVTVLSLVVLLACFFFGLRGRRAALLQLLVAAVGGSVGSTLLKRVWNRPRPSIVSRLVEVASPSYPSGHSLASMTIYLTLALLVAPALPRRAARVQLIAMAIALACAVGLSRAYIGVHYPSDILAGWLLGSGWALLVAAVFSFLRGRGAQAQ